MFGELTPLNQKLSVRQIFSKNVAQITGIPFPLPNGNGDINSYYI